LDGQGRVLGGAIVGKKSFIMDKVFPYVRTAGPTLSAFNAWVFLKGLETLDLRMKQQSANALALAQWLEKQQDLLDIYLYGYEIIDNYGKIVKKRKSVQNIYSNKYNTVLNTCFMNFITFPFYYCHPAFYIIRTKVAKEIVLDSSIGIGEDFDFLIRVLNNIDRVNSWAIRNKILFQWRKHQGIAENQSSNIFNRFLTKFNIFLKYKNADKTKLRLFPFLVLPMYFDNYSLDLNKQQLNLINDYNQNLESEFIKYSFLRLWPFKFMYFLYRIMEYIKIQLLILFS
jgi:hypothetical protein